MYCKFCGAIITSDDKFCPTCGNPSNLDESPNSVNMNIPEEEKTEVITQSNSPTAQEFEVPDKTPQTNIVPEENYNYGYVKPEKKKLTFDGLKPVILIVLGIVILVAVFFVFRHFFAKVTTNIVYQQGFRHEIPSDYVVEISSDILIVSDLKNTFTMSIDFTDGSYSELLAKKALIKTNLENIGGSATEAKVENYDNREFITTEYKDLSGNNLIIAYTKATDKKTFVITIYDINNKIKSDLLKDATKILQNSYYEGGTLKLKDNINYIIPRSIAKF